MHTHIKVILPQIIGEILLVLAAAIGSFYVPEDSRYWALPTIWIVVLVLTVPLLFDPVGQVDQFHLHGDHQAHYHPQGRLYSHGS